MTVRDFVIAAIFMGGALLITSMVANALQSRASQDAAARGGDYRPPAIVSSR